MKVPWAGIGLLAAVITASPAGGEEPRLNVYNWSAYVAPDTIPNFEKEFGVRVRYVTYESNEEMLAQVVSGNSGWDIVFPTHNRVPPMSSIYAGRVLAPFTTSHCDRGGDDGSARHRRFAARPRRQHPDGAFAASCG